MATRALENGGFSRQYVSVRPSAESVGRCSGPVARVVTAFVRTLTATIRLWGSVSAAARDSADGRWRESAARNGNSSRVRHVEVVNESAIRTDHVPGLAEELDDIERRRLLDALTAAGGNKAKAARLLGYRRTTYCSKLKKFGIQ